MRVVDLTLLVELGLEIEGALERADLRRRRVITSQAMLSRLSSMPLRMRGGLQICSDINRPEGRCFLAALLLTLNFLGRRKSHPSTRRRGNRQSSRHQLQRVER